MKRMLLAVLTATTCAFAMAAPQPAHAADATLDCKLTYNLTGIPVAPAVIAELNELAMDLGIDPLPLLKTTRA